MIQYEAIDGPYSRWLREVQERLGERVWSIVQDMSCEEAEVMLAAKGIVPFKDSPHYLRWRLAMDMDVKAPEKYGIVKMVPVVYMEGDIVEVRPEVTDPGSVHDPRTLVVGTDDPLLADFSLEEPIDDF